MIVLTAEDKIKKKLKDTFVLPCSGVCCLAETEP